jgi:hypothetical protein
MEINGQFKISKKLQNSIQLRSLSHKVRKEPKTIKINQS